MVNVKVAVGVIFAGIASWVTKDASVAYHIVTGIVDMPVDPQSRFVLVDNTLHVTCVGSDSFVSHIVFRDRTERRSVVSDNNNLPS